MGWERQGGHQLLFRTLFLTHVGVSSHVQMWTFQKVPSQIAQFPFQQSQEAQGKPVSFGEDESQREGRILSYLWI